MIEITVPPVIGEIVGLTSVIDSRAVIKKTPYVVEKSKPLLATLTDTSSPAFLGGAVHSTASEENHLAETFVTPNMQDRDAKFWKPLPLTRTMVLPWSGPFDGEMLVTTSSPE
jgi:hypothetical protein